MRRARNLRRDERGAALMEFGLLVVPFCMLLLGMLDIGYQMYLRSTLQGALNDVSRTAVVENPSIAGTGTIQERISAAVRKRLAGLASHGTWNLSVASFEDYSSVNVPEKLTYDPNRNGSVDAGDCWIDLQVNGVHDARPQRSNIGGAEDIALYTATMRMPRLLPMAKLAGMSPNYEITVRSVVRNQPYANQSPPPTACRPRP